ncbi:hypothetical protein [Thiohalophilus sp.]|uniref:hypothetical protein n=1 Tax=Thiohalophilus sp. TaxID=3028392 RepID=UPI002ACE61B2|nr:hypothetical protein [Thiohalophilus sp.]MDZ7663357.1 hypothetical protein [Thiohalophilus sp.]
MKLRFAELVVLTLAAAIITGYPAAAETAAKPGAAMPGDTRELLPIPFTTRDKLLHKMNQDNLGALGRMLDALSRDDLAQVARIANDLSYTDKTEKFSRRRGSKTFAVMATDFHGQKMPAIREAAEQGDRQQVLRRMSEAVQSCMGCHSAVRMVEWPNERQYTTPAPVSLPDAIPVPQRRIPDYQYSTNAESQP